MSETLPIDAIPVNGWVMELPNMTNPHIMKVTGLSRKTGSTNVVDGGTNRKFFFSDGISEQGPLTISRTRDGSIEDTTFQNFVETVIARGTKVNGTLLQYRFSTLVMKIQFTGLLLHEFEHNDLDVGGSDLSEQKYTAQVDLLKFLYNSDARK